MPADHVVSPAVTIRRTLEGGNCCWYCGLPVATEQDWAECPEGGGEHLCWDTGGADCDHAGAITLRRDDVAALLAVGERDSDEREQMHAHISGLHDLNEELLAQGVRDRQHIAQLTERLEPVQQRVLGMIERNGFVFRTPLDKPDNERSDAERWEKLAFTLYAEICETDTIVRDVLAGEEDAEGLDDSPFLGPDRDAAPLDYPRAIDEGAR